MSNGVRAYNSTAAALQTVSKLRYASERIARELREVQSVGGNFAIATPVSAPGNRITFNKWDGAQTVQVTIDGSAATLTLQYDTLADNAPFTLTDEVTGVTFSYFRRDGTPASSTADVAYIEFELVLNNGANYNQRTRVALRNRS